MTKTKEQYNALFESLMKYSSFKNVQQIKSKEDLRNFFSEIKEDSSSKGNVFKVSNKLRFEMDEAQIRLRKNPDTRDKVFQTNKERVTKSKNVFNNYKMALRVGMVVPNEDGKAVFKSLRKYKGKQSLVYRDAKGRFAKAPVVALQEE